MPTKKKPYREALRRRNIQGALWRNTRQEENGDVVPFYTPSVTRSYKDKNGDWQNETLYVPLDDIPRVIAVLQEMETSAYQQLQADYDARAAQQGATVEEAPVAAGTADDDF